MVFTCIQPRPLQFLLSHGVPWGIPCHYPKLFMKETHQALVATTFALPWHCRGSQIGHICSGVGVEQWARWRSRRQICSPHSTCETQQVCDLHFQLTAEQRKGSHLPWSGGSLGSTQPLFFPWKASVNREELEGSIRQRGITSMTLPVSGTAACQEGFSCSLHLWYAIIFYEKKGKCQV